eukprot:269876_1
MANTANTPLLDDGYNTGNMYGQPLETTQSQQQPPSYNPQYQQQQIQPQQAQYANPQYQQQQQQIQPQLIPQQQQQQQSQPITVGTAAQFADEQPPAWEEGEIPGVVSEPKEPCKVHGSQDGVGCSEGCARNPHILSWILTIGVWYMVFTLILCLGVFNDNTEGYCGWFNVNIGAGFGILGGIAVIYWIECCCAGTGKYLRHILTGSGAKDFVANIRRKEAQISWHVAYYIWREERRTVHYNDKDGNRKSRQETHWHKEYIHRASMPYNYSTCYDVSGQLLGLDIYNVTKLKFHKTYGFADQESRNDYSFRKRAFRNDNWRIAWVKRWNPLFNWHAWGCYRGHRGWMIHEEFH